MAMTVSPTIRSLPGPKVRALTFFFTDMRRMARSCLGSSVTTRASIVVLSESVAVILLASAMTWWLVTT